MSHRISMTLGVVLAGVAMTSALVAFAPAAPKAPVSVGAALTTPYRSALSDVEVVGHVAAATSCSNTACHHKDGGTAASCHRHGGMNCISFFGVCGSGPC